MGSGIKMGYVFLILVKFFERILQVVQVNGFTDVFVHTRQNSFFPITLHSVSGHGYYKRLSAGIF